MLGDLDAGEVSVVTDKEYMATTTEQGVFVISLDSTNILLKAEARSLHSIEFDIKSANYWWTDRHIDTTEALAAWKAEEWLEPATKENSIDCPNGKADCGCRVIVISGGGFFAESHKIVLCAKHRRGLNDANDD